MGEFRHNQVKLNITSSEKGYSCLVHAPDISQKLNHYFVV